MSSLLEAINRVRTTIDGHQGENLSEEGTKVALINPVR
jgi:hypothetical protein